MTYQPTCEIRNNSKKAVTYGGSGSNCEVIITGVLTDKNGKEYPMTYVGENGSAPAGEKYEVKDFKLVAVGKGLYMEGSKVVKMCIRDRVWMALDHPVILAADVLMPTDLFSVPSGMILGLITSEGSGQSHAAIIARAMNIPGIVQVGQGCLLYTSWKTRA